MESKVKIRPATKADVIAINGAAYSHSFRGLAAELNGECLGVAGVMYTHPAQCFSTLKPEMKSHKRAIVSAVRQLRDILNQSGEVYAIPSKFEPTARGFLNHVGFVPVKEDLYKWPTPQH